MLDTVPGMRRHGHDGIGIYTVVPSEPQVINLEDKRSAMSRNIQNLTILVAGLCIGSLAICRAASAQSVPGPWSSTTSYTVGALAVGTDTNLYRSVKNGNLNHGPTTNKGKNWELDKVSASVSLHVPKRFANIQAALNFIEIATISGNATVTISVADGNYAYTSPITVNVPCGDRVQIIGDNENPAGLPIQLRGHRRR